MHIVCRVSGVLLATSHRALHEAPIAGKKASGYAPPSHGRNARG